jgi:hypothetical protein
MRKNDHILSKLFEGLIIISLVNCVYNVIKYCLHFLDNYVIIIPLIIINTVEYYIYYNYPKDTREIRKTRLSVIHAMVLFISNLCYINSFISTELWKTTLLYSVIYNVLDMEHLYFSKIKIRYQLLFHHFILIVCILPILIPKVHTYIQVHSGYNMLVANNFLCEITTIPLNLGWILQAQGKQKTLVFNLYVMLTLFLYIPFRLFLTAYLSYTNLYIETKFKYFQFMLTGLNYYWFSKMLQKVFITKFGGE